MSDRTEHYGPHLMMDLGGCDPEILDDLDACFSFLNGLPAKIGMTKITQPYVFRYTAEKPEDSGITGVTIIAESHISVHTYPMKSFAFVDMFSCKPFDVKQARNYVVRFFKSSSPVAHIQNRGEFFSVSMGPTPYARTRNSIPTGNGTNAYSGENCHLFRK